MRRVAVFWALAALLSCASRGDISGRASEAPERLSDAALTDKVAADSKLEKHEVKPEPIDRQITRDFVAEAARAELRVGGLFMTSDRQICTNTPAAGG